MTQKKTKFMYSWWNGFITERLVSSCDQWINKEKLAEAPKTTHDPVIPPTNSTSHAMTGKLSTVQFMTGYSDPQTHVTIAEITKIQRIIHSAHKYVQLNFCLLLWRSCLNITKFGDWHCSESCRHVVRNVTALYYSNADTVHNTIHSELFNSKGCNTASYHKLAVCKLTT